MFAFGAGAYFATPLQDAYGNAVANPTPVQLGTAQDGTFDMKFDLKMLHGELQFPVAVARGKGSIDLKLKAARINAAAFNSVVFGQGATLTNGLQTAYYDVVGSAVPATPFQITVTPPNSGTFLNDLGVRDGNGVPYTRVASAPAAGQYTVSGGGIYLFNTGDTGKIVFISYGYTVASAQIASARTNVVKNLPMGQQPVIKLDYFTKYQGKDMVFSFPQVITGGMSLSVKNDDFAVPDFTLGAFGDSNNNVMTWSTFE